MKRGLKQKNNLIKGILLTMLVMCLTVCNVATVKAALSEEASVSTATGTTNGTEGNVVITLSEKTANSMSSSTVLQLKQALDGVPVGSVNLIDATKGDGSDKNAQASAKSGNACFVINHTDANGTTTPASDTFSINPTVWNSLTKGQQEDVLNVIAGSEYYSSLTDSDQTCIIEGFKMSGTKDGTTLMTILFGNTKPNWVSAYKIIAPFNGPVGTFLGAGTMFMAIALIIVILCDVFYMTIPWFRVKGDSKEDIRWVSHEAKIAVEKVEGSGDGKKTQVLWEYLKHKVVMLFLFGLCILYLLCGNIFEFLGYLLDLASGTM